MAYSTANLLNNIMHKHAVQGVSFDFVQGDYQSALQNLLTQFAPCGKIAVLYFQSTYERISKNISLSAKRVGYKTSHLVLPNDFVDCIEQYSGVFNLAEDARMIVTADVGLYNLAKYFATIREVPCVLIYDGQTKYGLFSNYAQIINGRKTEKFDFNCQVKFVIDNACFDNFDGKLSDFYAHTVSYAFGLLDYRLNCTATKSDVDQQAYSLALRAIKRAFKVFTNGYNEQATELVTALFEIELACAYTNQALTNTFSAYNCFMIEKDCKNQGKSELLYSVAIAKLFALYLSNQFDQLLTYPNYLQRAEKLGKVLLVAQDKIIKCLNDQSEIIKQNTAEIDATAKTVLDEVKNFIRQESTMLNTFKALKGQAQNDIKNFNFALKHCGDFVDGINCVSLIRESGILENI